MSLADLLRVGSNAKTEVDKPIPLSTDEPVLRKSRFSEKPPDHNSADAKALSSKLLLNLEELQLAQELVESQEEVLKKDAETREAETEALNNKRIDDAATAAKKLAKHMASVRKVEPSFSGAAFNPFSTGGAVEFPRGKWVGEQVTARPSLTTLDKVRQQARDAGVPCWGKGADWGGIEWATAAAGWGASDAAAAWGCGADNSWGKGAWPAAALGKGVGWGEAVNWDVGAGAGASWASSSSGVAAGWSAGYGCIGGASKGFGIISGAAGKGGGGGPYDCKGGGYGFGGGIPSVQIRGSAKGGKSAYDVW